MHAQLAGKLDAPSKGCTRAREARARSARDTGAAGEMARLEAVLREDLARERELGVAVTRGCGTVEVRVLGPAATLALFFDAGEAQAAHVRLAVRAAIARYASSLGEGTPDRTGD